MQPSTRNPNFSVTLDQWSEVTTTNAALNHLIDAVPHKAEDIRSIMGHVIAGADLAPTIHNAYTSVTPDSSPDIAVHLTPSQVEIARMALTFAAETSSDALDGDFFAGMAAEIEATAKLSAELKR